MENTNKNEILFDALLTEALIRKMETDAATLPSEEELRELYQPSPEMDKRIKKLIDNHYRKAEMKRFAGKFVKVVASVVISFALLLTGLLSVEATRNAIFNTLIEWNEKYVRIEFKPADESSTLEGIYQPTWLPQGFKQTAVDELGSGHMLIYENDNDEMIVISQWKYGTGASAFDNENKKFLETKISGNKAYLLETTVDNDSSILTWQAGNMVFEVIAPIDTKDLIRMAESLKK